MRLPLCLLITLCSLGAAHAADFKVGDDVLLTTASICVSKEAAEVVADAARKTGSGQDAWNVQLVTGECFSGGLQGTIVGIVDTYPDTVSSVGSEDIIEVSVEGFLNVFVFAPHGTVLAGLPV